MTSKAAVTVIGLGPMGQATVRTLLAGGHPVTVWNRTASRADGVVAEGARRAASPAEALAASELVVLSLTDFAAMYDILEPAAGALAGKTVVNLSSDTPQTSRQAAEWVAARGANLLVGGIMCPAPMVGTEAAYVYYSGPRAEFEAHESTLRLIGAPRFVGTDPGLAQLYYQAQLTVFLGGISAVLQATALVASAGVPAEDFVPEAITTLDDTSAMLGSHDDLRAALSQRQYPGELSTVTMMGATADHIVAASTEAGIDTALPRAVQSHYQRAISAGHGQDGWASLYEVIRHMAART
ncbi:3-hydroxyisobutyrate dehydrogenase-like beta-hydroxyacid dehydrogenase [Tamaricihabitans halophyticus]|uniref:3-hydroxyisobutyrate dehydrogenase-like beta-hydroxyacid dehydrogenase n=1 Tax=Tamaricihabitans halophyticus TaxID=1262583 RepID=A0A4R2R196_9PSEU|nr:NAD(P)-binding domain-containing protein [Tamaricihabitans halophyticus]TCP56442.1 3-hydroxyisobutyrate dehydrogenase-like beta-hydroxyacid dehydrogenase [Tamaricihabitans halophyticus]